MPWLPGCGQPIILGSSITRLPVTVGMLGVMKFAKASSRRTFLMRRKEVWLKILILKTLTVAGEQMEEGLKVAG